MASTYRSDLKTRSRTVSILYFQTKLLLQLMNLESRKERKERKEKKGTPRKNVLFYYCYSFHTSQIVVALRAIKLQLLVALDTS